MDCVTKFDIELDKDIFYAGETLTGHIIVQNTENIKVQGIRLLLRGKSHVEWKVTKAGERRTVKDDEYYIDEKKVVWGKDKKEVEGGVPIMPRGNHRYNFQFKLPESTLPCSFESKVGTIRYYLRATMDMPVSSSPQSKKYFSIIGPHIDCMDERYLTPSRASDKRYSCCFCCSQGPVALEAVLERSAYCAGENIKLRAEIQNGSDQDVWLVCKLVQHVEFFINKGVLGLCKEASHKVWQYRGDTVRAHATEKFDDLQQYLQLPVVPPSMVDVCSLVQIYYTLKVCLVMEESGEVLDLHFPVTVATTPYRIPNAPYPILQYDHCVPNVEGGMYVSSEFQLGQVYMGDGEEETDEVILFRPLYVCVPHERLQVNSLEKEGGVSRAASRMSMTRLSDRLKFKEPRVTVISSEKDSAKMDSEEASPSHVTSHADGLSPLFAQVDLESQFNQKPSDDLTKGQLEDVCEQDTDPHCSVKITDITNSEVKVCLDVTDSHLELPKQT